MIKRISELNNDELRKVFQENEKLQDEVEEYMTDGEMHYISDNLNKFRKYLSDWNIGFYNQNYIQVKDGYESEFIQGVFDARNDYGFLSDEEFEKWQSVDFWVFDEDFEKDSSYLDENLFNEFVQVVLNRFNEMTDIYNYDIEGYFVEFYSDAVMNDDDFYIDYETFELFETITKSYK